MDIAQRTIMFGGKGGVGKTTVSAFAGLYFASRGEKTLIITTDPVLSLSDLFETKIGDTETPIAENLYAIELSTDEVLKRWKNKFGDEVYEVISSIVNVDNDIVNYVATAPGIDEEFMLDYIMELVENEKYDRIIWDTAPTGHTMKLLTMPFQYIDHLDQAAKVYMGMKDSFSKLQMAVGLKKKKRTIFDIIDSWRKLAEKTVDFLKNKDQVGFVGVTIPEALGVFQIERLISDFDNIGLNTSHIVINGVIQKADCDFHTRKKKVQEKYIGRIREKFGNRMEIIEIPLYPHEITGLEALKEVESKLFD
ncbi:ArsA family ATPase [bacterium]|nr:ArsA family ATPase [bacterium]